MDLLKGRGSEINFIAALNSRPWDFSYPFR
jgi:hypothetical protein